MKLIKFFSGLLMITAFLLLAACSGDKPQSEVKAAENEMSTEYNSQYDFTAEKLDGSEFKLSDFAGKVVIIDFWDTWCPPCRKGIPDFVDLYNTYNEQGLVIIGLAFGQQGKPAVEQFVKEYNITYVNGLVNQDVVSRFGTPRSIPTTYIIDQKGNVHQKYVGLVEKSVFEKEILSLLNISV